MAIPTYEFLESIHCPGGRPFPFVAGELLIRFRNGELALIQCGACIDSPSAGIYWCDQCQGPSDNPTEHGICQSCAGTWAPVQTCAVCGMEDCFNPDLCDERALARYAAPGSINLLEGFIR